MTVLYSDNFDSDTVGSLPAGWIVSAGTWAVGTIFPVSGAQSLSGGITSAAIAEYTTAGYAQANQTASVDFVYAAQSVRARPAPVIRKQAGALSGILVLLVNGSGTDAALAIYKFVNGTYTALVTTAHGVTMTAGSAYTLEVSAVGSVLEGRIYPSGGTRPATAQVTITPSSGIPSAGAPGIYNNVGSGATAGGFDNFVWTDAVTTAATAYTLTGPTTGLVGSASSNFTVTANGTVGTSTIVTPSDSGAGGAFSPTSITLSSSAASGTFTYTPASNGSKTISTTNNGSLTNPSSLSYLATTAATAVTLTGPTSGNTSVASTAFTVNLNGSSSAAVTVTPNDNANGGTFSPTSVTIAAGATPTAMTFTYTPATPGTKTIGVTNSASLTNPSSISYVVTNVAATATTLIGPTTGTVGTISSVFTASANGTITGTVIVTPNDNSGGGTFSPTTVSLTAAAPSATFTYTPASAGAKTISTTNNGSLTNAANITFTASAFTGIAVNDPNIFYSISNWDTLNVGDFGVTTMSMQTTACGAYLKLAVTGITALTLLLDSSMYSGYVAGNTPRLQWSINGGAMNYAQITIGAATLSLATGLTSGNVNTVEIFLLGSVSGTGDRWGSTGSAASNSPTNALRIQGFSTDAAPTTSAYPRIRPKRIVCFGDSITEGRAAANSTVEPNDHAQSAAWFEGVALNAEYGVIGYASTGWAKAGAGNMPAFPTTWNFHSSGRARTFPTLDIVFVNHGYNGTTSGSVVMAWLTTARATFGANTWIFIVGNPGGVGNSGNLAGVTAYLSANPSDTKVAFIDLTTVLESRFFNGTTGNVSTEYSVDGIHPIVVANAMIASRVTLAVQASMDAVPTSNTGVTLMAAGLGGVGFVPSTGQLVPVI
jgi:hypothetical protein